MLIALTRGEEAQLLFTCRVQLRIEPFISARTGTGAIVDNHDGTGLECSVICVTITDTSGAAGKTKLHS